MALNQVYSDPNSDPKKQQYTQVSYNQKVYCVGSSLYRE